MNTDEVLTVREVASRLKVSAACVYQLIGECKIAHVRIGCGRGAIRVAESDLQAFLASVKVEQHSLNTTELKHIRLRR